MMTTDNDLDPQEALDAGYDEATDLTTDEETAEPTTMQDEEYVLDPVEVSDGGTVFDPEGWPDDELVIADHDGIDEGGEE